MSLSTCEHPDTIVEYDSGRECPLCQALSDLTDAQTALQDSAFIAACTEAVEVLCHSSMDPESRRIGQRLALELEHATEKGERES